MTHTERIAHQYAKIIAAQCRKVWISDNLPQLDRKDRKRVLAVYQQYFKTVDYDPNTGICRCWVGDPEPLSADDTFGEFVGVNHPTGEVGSKIKDSTLKAIGAGTVEFGGVVVSNIERE